MLCLFNVLNKLVNGFNWPDMCPLLFCNKRVDYRELKYSVVPENWFLYLKIRHIIALVIRL